ncbi:hypothetical protein ACWPKO_25455 (plasmid) [Coraliomargarita sp. W4R53]
MVTLYTVTLAVVCCFAVALAISTERRFRATTSSWATTSTFAVLTATCATLSTLSYAMSGDNDENLVPLVIGDVTMPLSIGLLAATIRRATGKRQTGVVWFVLISFAVGAATLFVSPEMGQTVKLIALAGLSAVVALTCFDGRERLPPSGALLVGVTTGLFGVYCLLRLSEPFVASSVDPMVAEALGRGPSTVVAAVVIGIVSAGVIVILRRSSTDDELLIVGSEGLIDWIDALLVKREELTAVGVSIPDIHLHRAAFGNAWTIAAAEAAARATRSTMPYGTVIGRVAPTVLVALHFGTSLNLETTAAQLQRSYAALTPDNAQTRLPDVLVERLDIATSADIRRFARQARATARRATTSRGV